MDPLSWLKLSPELQKQLQDMRYAILDLGTNTFNLLIIEAGTGNRGNIILSRKEPVKLGEDGITRGMISERAFARGLAAIGNHMRYINDCRAGHIYAYATSAIRSAGNGLEFVRVVYEKFNIGIQVISGDKEAELIYRGVKQAVDMADTRHLILDIGGGSNELIIADGNRIYWKKSFPMGMARLLEQFRPSDPVTPQEIKEFEDYFGLHLDSFFEAAFIHRPDILIGSSGTFDTFRALLSENYRGGEPSGSPFFTIDTDDFGKLHQRLLESTSAERLRMKGMDPVRVEMIVIAAIFVNFIVSRLNIRTMIQSDYSLKEGAVSEILEQQMLST